MASTRRADSAGTEDGFGSTTRGISGFATLSAERSRLGLVARTEASVRDRARRLVDSMITAHPDGRGELVSELAGPLPLQVICDMIGIPEQDQQKIFHWTNVILGASDPDVTADFEEFATASMVRRLFDGMAEDPFVHSRTRITVRTCPSHAGQLDHRQDATHLR